MGAKVGNQESKATKSKAYTKHNKRMSRLPVNAVDATVASDSFVGALLSEFFADQSVSDLKITLDMELDQLRSVSTFTLPLKEGGGAGMIIIDPLAKYVSFQSIIPNEFDSWDTKLTPAMAIFSSKGPTIITPDIIKIGTVIREEVGLTLENAGSEVLGLAAKVVLAKDTTTIVGDGSTQELINLWVAQIRNLIEATEHDYEKEKLNERITELFGGVAVIQVSFSSLLNVDCLNKEEHNLSSLAGSSSMNQPTSLTVPATRCNEQDKSWHVQMRLIAQVNKIPRVKTMSSNWYL
ncbi:Chaperonin Cpn60 [Artemisia annua]|uniref:Chaperonin Cpn60 n=1 Tax=Artemisia annua TaxID=35608 RepID=A0A2U1P1J4_ARTAN|nr:Chaperonin Cpn60 [Artemisia annua]